MIKCSPWLVTVFCQGSSFGCQSQPSNSSLAASPTQQSLRKLFFYTNYMPCASVTESFLGADCHRRSAYWAAWPPSTDTLHSERARKQGVIGMYPDGLPMSHVAPFGSGFVLVDKMSLAISIRYFLKPEEYRARYLYIVPRTVTSSLSK